MILARPWTSTCVPSIVFHQLASGHLVHPRAISSGQPFMTLHHPAENTFEQDLSEERNCFRTEGIASANVLRPECTWYV